MWCSFRRRAPTIKRPRGSVLINPVRTYTSWPSERQVAEEVQIDLDVESAKRLLASGAAVCVPFVGLGPLTTACTHRARHATTASVASIPESDLRRCLGSPDVGAWAAFYSFLAEQRGAARVLAVDSEQYIHWVRDRWGVELTGGEGFWAIHDALGSKVEYARMDAFQLAGFEGRFDFIFCFGILWPRLKGPLGLLRVLSSVLNRGAQLPLEMYRIDDDAGGEDGVLHASTPGAVDAQQSLCLLAFSSSAIADLLRILLRAGLGFDVHAMPCPSMDILASSASPRRAQPLG